MPGRLIVVSGPSGSGKSTVVSALFDRLPLEFSVSATTRPPRLGEEDGVHYWFVSRSEFERMVEQGELLESAEYNHELYGTPAAPVATAIEEGRDILLEIEIQGARQVRAAVPDAILIFISPPSMRELERRLRNRGDTSEGDMEERLAIAAREMAEAPDLFDHIVVNETVMEVVDQMVDLLSR